MNTKSVSRVAINLIRTRVEEAKENVHKEFNSLLKLQPIFEIYTPEEIENGDMDDYFDRRNEISGNVFECRIYKVDAEGIYCIDTNDNERQTIKFSDLSSLDDQISLLELMLTKLK